MAILKSNDISNDPAVNSKLKTTAARDEILQRYDPTKLNNILPCDDGLAYLSEKVDQCIDSINPNILKVGISDDQASAITRNTSKTGITDAQTSAITANTAKNTNVVQTSVTGNAGTATKIASITNDNIVQLAGNQTLTGTKTFSATIVGSVNGNSATTSETTITSGQASAITANTSKTGITSGQASAITANTAKVGTETTLSTTEGLTLRATVTESRGTYTLRFTMVTADGRTTKTADITMS